MRPPFHQLFLPLCLLALSVSRLEAQSSANFVSMSPCRVIDTREKSFGAFGPPSLTTNSTRDFNLPASRCGVPAGVLAYSLNVTVVPNGSLP
jgi:hypothetical protein